ncbi:aminotransferase class I and II [Caldalkalibacillus thermarum TA2.A1]|uniref:Aminotransferase n=2 Tax=Caldalkalibacillus TaxID=379065 RepID=F5L4D2_CALTT|nr:aminotransferase class I and II [Caldalkalibacillus thermarum TA2.A1]QZT35329.1 LL-diaminopimelate aminotransferase [Caldalkalibacillus thermarum TA2.A1]
MISHRVRQLPPYLLSVLQEKKERLLKQGVDVIDLGIGAPDLPTPGFIVDKLMEELAEPQNFKYSPYKGLREFREAVADFYEQEYGVKLDPDTEVLTLIGSKEGIAHLLPAVIDPGEVVLVPDPGYPVYRTAAYLAGGECVSLPLDQANSYRPQFSKLDKEKLNRAKLMFLNYPSNPTAAVAGLDVFREAVAFAQAHQLAIAHDSAYALVTFGGYQAPSIMQAEGAKEVAVEFGSLSKSFNMTGWRIGYVVGNREIIQALAVIKSNTDTSQFIPIQKAAALALRSDRTVVKENNAIYEARMEEMLSALKEAGIQAAKPRATFFIWAQVPEGFTSAEFATRLLEEAGIVVMPGHAFGPRGEGFFRLSLSVPTERLREAARRIRQLGKEHTGK